MAQTKSMQRKIKWKKQMMLKALEKTLGVVAPAGDMAGIGRVQHYKWMNEDEEYHEAVMNINEKTLDFAETNLFRQIEEGNTQATLFYLKTKGKERGYTENATLDITNSDKSLSPTLIQLVAQPDLTIEGESETIQEQLVHYEDRTEKI